MDAKHAFNLTRRGARGAGTVEESARKRGETVREREVGDRHRMSACLDNNDS